MGYTVWLDKEQMARVGNIYDGMLDGLSRSKVICAFLSTAYEASANCKRELQFAADLKLPIIPIRVDCGPFTWSHLLTSGKLYVELWDRPCQDNGSPAFSGKMEQLENLIRGELAKQANSHQHCPVAPAPAINPGTTPAPAEEAPAVSKAQLKAILDPSDVLMMENDVEEVSRKRLRGTREWLLKDVKDWATGGKTSPVMWVAASAGAGKSVVAASAIVELRSEEKRSDLVLGGFFICKADRADRNDPSRLVRTIAYQIASTFPTIAEHVNGLEADEPGFAKKLNVARAFQLLVIDPLTKVQPTKPIIIVLDALDECGSPESPDRAALLHSIGNTSLPDHVKLLITSRAETDINSELQTYVPYKIELDEERNQADLLLFAKDRMSVKFRTAKLEVMEERAHALVERSHGLFIWLYLACEEIRRAVDGTKAYGFLVSGERVGSADRMMDQMYTRTLGRAFDGVDHYDDEGWLEAFRRILGAIITVRVPLDGVALADLLECSEDTVINVLSRINSLLYIADDQIRVVHKSFADFLVNPKRCTDPRFFVVHFHRDDALAAGCFRLLNTQLRANMCGMEVSQLNQEVADLNHRIIVNIPKSVQYAARFWIDHLLCSTSTEALLPHLDHLLNEQLLNWLEVVSVLSIVDAIMFAMPKLVVWAKSVMVGDSRTTQLIHDVSRFIQEFTTVISLSAAHIRQSAAPFCPTETVLFQTYESDLSVAVQQGDRNWSSCVQTLEGDPERCFQIEMWNVQTGKIERRVQVQTEDGSHINKLAVTAGKRLVICALTALDHLHAWDGVTGNLLLHAHEGLKTRIEALAVDPKGSRVLGGSRDGSVRIWDVFSGSLWRKFDIHTAGVKGVAVASDGQTVVTGSFDKTAKVWNIESGVVFALFEGHTSGINCLAITVDDRKVVTGSMDHTIKVWDLQTQHLHPQTFEGHNNLLNGIAISEDRRWIVTISADATAKIWDSRTGTLAHTCTGHSTIVHCVALAKSGTVLATASFDKTAMIWEVGTGKRQKTINLGKAPHSIDISADGQIMTTVMDYDVVKVWNVGTGIVLYTFTHELSTKLSPVSMTPDGHRIVFGSAYGRVHVLDVQTNTLRVLLPPDGMTKERVETVDITMDGCLVVSGSFQVGVVIWNLRTNDPPQLFENYNAVHHRYPMKVRAASDGRFIVAHSSEGATIWRHLESGDKVSYAGMDDDHQDILDELAIQPTEKDGWVYSAAGRRVGWLPVHFRGKIAQAEGGRVASFSASKRAVFVDGWLR
ncbi:hypothetical protein HDV00_008391 [Rhizophlyctis rosea]|nr:hypothetical protein HDV00_008391 [Rhizophlyctis rosea]